MPEMTNAGDKRTAGIERTIAYYKADDPTADLATYVVRLLIDLHYFTGDNFLDFEKLAKEAEAAYDEEFEASLIAMTDPSG